MSVVNDYGLVISEEGYDAENCAPENTIFDTRYDTPKALIDETLNTVRRFNFLFTTTPPVGTTRIKTITHNFGYTPLIFSYLDRYVSSSPLYGFTVGRFYVAVTGIYWLGQITVKATSTEIQIDFVRQPLPSGQGLSDINMVGKNFTINVYIFSNDSKP